MFTRILIISVVGAFIVFCLVKVSSFFVIKEIRISADPSTPLLDIKKVLNEKFIGKNIFLYSEESLEKIILTNFPMIEEVDHSIKLPHTLVLRLTSREPFAIIVDSQHNRYLLDKKGFVMGMADKDRKDLPEIITQHKDKKLFVGERIKDEKVISALNFFYEAKKLKIKVRSSIVSKDIGIIIDPNITVVIPVGGNIGERVLLLQKILQKYNIEGKEIKKIDLRFANPIIDFK